MSFAKEFLGEAELIAARLDTTTIDSLAEELALVRDGGGRLFFLGVGGGAGHAGHAVNDFRKLAGFEAYAPTDNVSELTARINDEGWESCFAEWLRGSRLDRRDAVFVLSVGGGNVASRISVNLVRALEHAQSVGARIFGIVGRDGGFTAQVADVCVRIPAVNPQHVTAHTEGFQAVIWHLLVSHPVLHAYPTKWESVSDALNRSSPGDAA